MLKINKILSKKIKSPLSLLGLFPFCHSRESGNPSFLSLRGVKQQSNLNHNGFSLIELMIAVTILAMAVFGIFHAYSVGFLGMADARDRTVATNYAREAMEDVKNMDFELVTNENLGIAESVGEKFTRVISVNTENGNLKNITTLVYWNNKNGKTINIETSMYINRTLFNPGEAVKIVLYASPYYAVLPSAGFANIIAIIKDISGNTKIDWNGDDIHFSILGSGYSDEPKGSIGSYLGYLGPGADDIYITPNEGRAETIFTGIEYLDIDGNVQQGDVVIEASVTLPDGSTVSDTVTIAVTLDVIGIKLLADPTSIEANGTSISVVTAALKNSGDVTVEDAKNNVTFNISGEGTFVNLEGEALPNPSTLIPPDVPGGIATIYVKSIDDTPGVAIVTASSEGLLSDTVNIITTGEAKSISVSVNPNLIYTDDIEGARVTVEIQDINGNPIEYSGDISLATSDGTGIFEHDTDCDPANPNSLCFSEVSSKYTTFSSASIGIVNITASGVDLVAGATTIEVRSALIADTITIKAVPKNILAGGIDVVSEITATIKQGSTVISNYDHDITFKIISDTSSSHDASLSLTVNGSPYGLDSPLPLEGDDYGNDGVAVVYLNPASYVGIVTIEVSTVNSLGDLIMNTVEVGFYSSEDRIELKAVPSEMLVNGDTCTVTATVVDEEGNTVVGYNEDITFTILVGWPKIAKFALTGTSSLTKTLVGGEITVDLIPQKEAGTVTLKASSFTGMTDIIGYLNISVDITLINLVEDTPAYSLTEDENRVTFDIDVQGAGVILEEMQVSWSDNIASEILNKIDIGGNEVYSNAEGVASGTPVYIDPTIDLPTGIYTVEIFFNSDMSEKELIIIFNPSSEYYYPVGFSIPAPLP